MDVCCQKEFVRRHGSMHHIPLDIPVLHTLFVEVRNAERQNVEIQIVKMTSTIFQP
jgi:hypothetical protein